jgi:hypothetical protein
MIQIDTWNPELPFVHEGVCFDPQNGSGATGNNININYRGFVAFITPEKFLSLCLPLGKEKRSSADFFEQAIPQGHCIAPPMLYLSQDNAGWKIDGHEGRHRALACKNLGLKTIPVSFYPRDFRSRNCEAFIDAGEFFMIRSEGGLVHTSRWVSLDAEIFVVDTRVLVKHQFYARGWVRPVSVETEAFKDPIPGYDAHYYYSKKKNPVRRTAKRLPKRRNFQVYSDGREYHITVRAPMPHYDVEENTRYLQEVAAIIQEIADEAHISELDILHQEGKLHDDGESVSYDFLMVLNNTGAGKRFFRALRAEFGNTESIKVMMLEK